MDKLAEILCRLRDKFKAIVSFIMRSRCYIYRLVVGWFLLIIVVNHTSWVVEKLLFDVLHIEVTRIRYIVDRMNIFLFILFPELLFQIVIILWYVVRCKESVYRRHRSDLRLAAFMLLVYWGYLSSFNELLPVIGPLVEVFPNRVPFAIIYHFSHIVLFMILLYFWEKIWDS